MQHGGPEECTAHRPRARRRRHATLAPSGSIGRRRRPDGAAGARRRTNRCSCRCAERVRQPGGGPKPAEQRIRPSRASRRSAAKRSRLQPQARARTLEGQQHPDHSTQLRSIDEQITQRRADREPTVSADMQKKEPLCQLPGPKRQATDGATENNPTQPLSGTWHTSPRK
ncbi:hypothetical protein [Streptomyces sp. NPDC058545]|uniref:ISAzo13-like element transposase-related protein n=1 Tax=Streptomyces sp. NPDC058545 TaxID=3346544 RepID=UPI00364D9EA5